MPRCPTIEVVLYPHRARLRDGNEPSIACYLCTRRRRQETQVATGYESNLVMYEQ
jgi:hypothetical protein